MNSTVLIDFKTVHPVLLFVLLYRPTTFTVSCTGVHAIPFSNHAKAAFRISRAESIQLPISEKRAHTITQTGFHISNR